MRIVYNLDADGEQVLCYTIINLFVRLPEQEVIMKQPDKMIAYYYRVDQKRTDLHLATKISSRDVYLDKQAFNAS